MVVSPLWDAGTPADVGAVTWGNGSMVFAGVVSPSNSLVGTTADDRVGSAGVTALSNGHYVVISPLFSASGFSINDQGAVTWANGNTGLSSTGLAGAVSQDNSLVGTRPTDRVGNAGVAALSNGNYVVGSFEWDGAGVLVNAGAATWASGGTGLSGLISSANSLIGTSANDFVGSNGITALSDGNYVVLSPSWNDLNVGAVTLARGATGLRGTIGPANSVQGTATSGGASMVFGYDPVREQLVVGRPASNIVSLFTLPGDIIFADGFE